MRHKFLGLAIAAIAALGPMQAWGGDREIAEQIIERLQEDRNSGVLKNFTLDMKVDKGVVLFRGKVDGDDQKNLVLKSAKGIDGIANIVDELTVNAHEPAKVAATGSVSDAGFSLREALADQARQIMAEDIQPSAGVTDLSATPIGAIETDSTGQVQPAANVELAAPVRSKDQKIVADVVSALSRAQKKGSLKGFGVDVKSNDGVVWLKGRAASRAQRNQILHMAEAIPGVSRVRNSIRIPEQETAASLPRLPEPPVLSKAPTKAASSRLAPVAVRPVPTPVRQSSAVPAAMVAAPMAVQAQPAPYRTPAAMTHQPLRTQPVQAMMGAPMGAPTMGMPVPMGGGGGIGAPRYDAPNLPNYAWPGYAAAPNYAALTYPQQYSPSAWPYIGPFYPYPQVPLGWRKVSLEWDDGWWQLDFTDR